MKDKGPPLIFDDASRREFIKKRTNVKMTKKDKIAKAKFQVKNLKTIMKERLGKAKEQSQNPAPTVEGEENQAGPSTREYKQDDKTISKKLQFRLHQLAVLENRHTVKRQTNTKGKKKRHGK